MNDEDTPQLVKNELIRQRGDKRYKIKGLWWHKIINSQSGSKRT
jgi:hypothetical protein